MPNAKISLKKKHKIVIIDDHPIVRYGIGQLINIENDLIVCGEAEDTKSGWEIIHKLKPDLAIVDISLKDVNSIDFIKSVIRRMPNFHILVVSIHNENVYAERVLKAGARGYIMKQEATEKVIEGIHSILSGQIYISDKISKKIIDMFYIGTKLKIKGNPLPQELLSDREFEVFRLTGKGYGVKEMGKHLNLSVKTVQTHRQKVKNKLKFNTTSELIKFAIDFINKSEM